MPRLAFRSGSNTEGGFRMFSGEVPVQVPDRVPRQAQFWKEDECGPGRARFLDLFQVLVNVPREIPEDRIDLGESDV